MPRTDRASRVIAAPPKHVYAVDIIADNVPDGIAAKDHAAGLASSLMNLAEYLEGSWKT